MKVNEVFFVYLTLVIPGTFSQFFFRNFFRQEFRPFSPVSVPHETGPVAPIEIRNAVLPPFQTFIPPKIIHEIQIPQFHGPEWRKTVMDRIRHQENIRKHVKSSVDTIVKKVINKRNATTIDIIPLLNSLLDTVRATNDEHFKKEEQLLKNISKQFKEPFFNLNVNATPGVDMAWRMFQNGLDVTQSMLKRGADMVLVAVIKNYTGDAIKLTFDWEATKIPVAIPELIETKLNDTKIQIGNLIDYISEIGDNNLLSNSSLEKINQTIINRLNELSVYDVSFYTPDWLDRFKSNLLYGLRQIVDKTVPETFFDQIKSILILNEEILEDASDATSISEDKSKHFLGPPVQPAFFGY